jgi:hypothetical protein
VGATGNSITWHPSDDNPSNYVVYRNGVSVAADTWNGFSITVNIDGLSEGVYNYTLTVFDILGNSIPDEVEVIVMEDMEDPTVDHPNDVVYTVGATGNSITWHPSDDNPSNYVVYRNGISVAADTWSGSSITVNIDGLSEGVYNYTLTVFDIYGNSMLDEVEVTVMEPTTTPTTTPDNDGLGMTGVFLIAVAGMAVAFIVLAIVIIRNDPLNPWIYHTS